MRVTFWGVRGSIPTPGPDTVETGGNTSCVEVRAGDALLVFDGGTGMRLLGKSLLPAMPVVAHVFFSHVHWDHIQGFPFFDPAFVPGNRIHLYGGGDEVSRTLEETLAGQMDHPNFPVHLTDMGATMTFHDVREGEVVEVDAGGGTTARVLATRGHHPNGVWIYRVEHGGRAVVYATDTEHGTPVDDALVAFASGADVLVYDAQYTREEYEGKAGRGGPKVGWGHSTFEAAASVATRARVKELVLFHHDPMQSDGDVRTKEARARALFPNVRAAREGLVVEV